MIPVNVTEATMSTFETYNPTWSDTKIVYIQYFLLLTLKYQENFSTVGFALVSHSKRKLSNSTTSFNLPSPSFDISTIGLSEK